MAFKFKKDVLMRMEERYIILKTVPGSDKVLYFGKWNQFHEDIKLVGLLSLENLKSARKLLGILDDENVHAYELTRNQVFNINIIQGNHDFTSLLDEMNIDRDTLLMEGGEDEYNKIFDYLNS